MTDAYAAQQKANSTILTISLDNINMEAFNPNKSINEYSDAYIDAMRWLTLYAINLNE